MERLRLITQIYCLLLIMLCSQAQTSSTHAQLPLACVPKYLVHFVGPELHFSTYCNSPQLAMVVEVDMDQKTIAIISQESTDLNFDDNAEVYQNKILSTFD